MSYSHDKIDIKVQEIIFRELLSRHENAECADCINKQPTWVSIDFGVFLCIRCSGVHRKLGPHITRVRSTKLDSWKQDVLEIIYSTGNKASNDYYEFRLPTGFKKLDENASDKECTKFVNDKYIKKSFSPPNYPDPVKEWKQNKKDNNTFINFDKMAEELADKFKKHQREKEHHKHVEITNEARPVRKKSLTLEDENNNNTKETTKQQQIQQKQVSIDFEDPFHHNEKKQEQPKDSFTFDWNFDMGSVNTNKGNDGGLLEQDVQPIQQKQQQQQLFEFPQQQQQKTQQNQQNQQQQQQQQQQQNNQQQQQGGFDVMKLYGNQSGGNKQEDKWAQLNGLYQNNQQQQFNQFNQNYNQQQQQNLYQQQNLQQNSFQQQNFQQQYQQQQYQQQNNLYNQYNQNQQINQYQQQQNNWGQQQNNWGQQQQQNQFSNNQFSNNYNQFGNNQNSYSNQNSFGGGYGNQQQNFGGNNQFQNQNQFSNNNNKSFGNNQSFGNNNFGLQNNNKNFSQSSNDLF